MVTAGLTIHQAFAQRGPAVEQLTEVSIEENTSTKTQSGFDFSPQPTATSPTSRRVPANIVSKSTETNSSPYSLIGPMIFLFALPAALWIIVAKKMKVSATNEQVGYYNQTTQFKPFKTSYQKQDIDDEDQDLPKAS